MLICFPYRVSRCLSQYIGEKLKTILNILKLTATLDENVTVTGNATAYGIKWTHCSVYVEIYISTKSIRETRAVSCNFS